MDIPPHPSIKPNLDRLKNGPMGDLYEKPIDFFYFLRESNKLTDNITKTLHVNPTSDKY